MTELIEKTSYESRHSKLIELFEDTMTSYSSTALEEYIANEIETV